MELKYGVKSTQIAQIKSSIKTELLQCLFLCIRKNWLKIYFLYHFVFVSCLFFYLCIWFFLCLFLVFLRCFNLDNTFLLHISFVFNISKSEETNVKRFFEKKSFFFCHISHKIHINRNEIYRKRNFMESKILHSFFL